MYVLCAALLVGLTFTTKAQQIEKLELILAPPIYLGNPALGYYEARGNVYAKGTAFDCATNPSIDRLGTYRIGVSFGSPSEHIATYLVRLKDGRDLLWQGYFKIDPEENGAVDFSWSYEGIVLHQTGTILTDFTPLSRSCFGGKLTVYFLNGG